MSGWRGGLTARFAGETDAPVGYYEYLPPIYGVGDPSPLLVFLEGVDEHGDGSEAELLATGIPELLATGQWPAERPFVVLAPQHAPPDDLEPYAGCCDSPELATGCFRIQSEAGIPRAARGVTRRQQSTISSPTPSTPTTSIPTASI